MLRDLVSFQSVKSAPAEGMPFGEEAQKAYAYMLAKAEADGFDTFDADGYGGHIEWTGAILDDRGEIAGAADGTLGIAVHLDVVPPGDGWEHDPWKSEASDGRIYGRGTSDDKGAASMIYHAMKALRESGHTPSKNVRLIIGLDEETGCSGMDRYLEAASIPDVGFSPDSDFPVINGEMGIMIFEIAKKLEAGHEEGLILRSVKGGNAPNMVPDFCRAILVFEGDAGSGKGGKAGSKKGAKAGAKTKKAPPSKETEARGRAFSLVKDAASSFREKSGARLTCKGTGNAIEVSAYGLSAHAMAPEKGVNAISVMMDFLGTLPLSNESARDFVDFYNARIGFETDGKSLGISMSDGLSGSLILNAGMIDLNREAAVLTVNARYPVSKKEEDVYAALTPALDKNGLGVVKLSNMEPLYFSPEDPLVKTLMEVYREETGDYESGPIVTAGGTYARSFPRAVAYGPRFPGEEEVMHQKDEYISIDSMMKAAMIYAGAILKLTEQHKNT